MLLQKSLMAQTLPHRIANAIPKHVEEEREFMEAAMHRENLKVGPMAVCPRT